MFEASTARATYRYSCDELHESHVVMTGAKGHMQLPLLHTHPLLRQVGMRQLHSAIDHVRRNVYFYTRPAHHHTMPDKVSTAHNFWTSKPTVHSSNHGLGRQQAQEYNNSKYYDSCSLRTTRSVNAQTRRWPRVQKSYPVK